MWARVTDLQFIGINDLEPSRSVLFGTYLQTYSYIPWNKNLLQIRA